MADSGELNKNSGFGALNVSETASIEHGVRKAFGRVSFGPIPHGFLAIPGELYIAYGVTPLVRHEAVLPE